jgi:hypothetical protein
MEHCGGGRNGTEWVMLRAPEPALMEFICATALKIVQRPGAGGGSCLQS